jgi:succinate dehydrogenase/fumarate reductase-like Fe-S protein
MNAALEQNRAVLKVWRGSDRETGRFEEFEIPFDDGESVLDGLVRVRRDLDAGLAVRFSCFNANVCKECTMLIDGEVQYACIAKLTPGTIEVAPIEGRPVLRDLVTDTLSKKERF